MARGAFAGIAGAWLSLIALDAVAQGGSGRLAQLAGDVNTAVARALSPSVPLIPDRRNAPTVGPGTPFSSAPSGSAVAGAHAGAQINPSTGRVVGFGY